MLVRDMEEEREKESDRELFFWFQDMVDIKWLQYLYWKNGEKLTLLLNIPQ